MSPLERLLQEAIPLRPKPVERPAPATPGGYWTADEQDEHWEALCRAVNAPNHQRPTQAPAAPHAAVQDPARAHAA